MNLLQQMGHAKQNWRGYAAWSCVFMICVLAYYPGLSGPFVLDDFGVMMALADYGGISDWESLKAFVLGGKAGPTGRPLAMLTFAFDANNWPADPFPLKRTNLLIHLMCGGLLGVLLRMLLALLDVAKQRASRIALVAAACWLLHPFLVSTTLYAVQRMAQLSTLFIFAAIIGYLYGRSLIRQNAVRAYAVMSGSLSLFGMLAIISKENGILLPMLVGAIELTVIASQGQRLASLNRYWAGIFLVFPTIVVGGLLGRTFFNADFLDVVPPRDFSLYERMLTEPRILIDYLQHWFLPKLYTTGVFQDHFIKSTSLFVPATTIASIAFHIVVISVAIWKRRSYPLMALAALFFYAGHALESTVLDLELYFEHRNYLAAALLWLPLVVGLDKVASQRVFLVASMAAILLLSGFTRYAATVWSDYSLMVAASAQKAPTSVRAQTRHAANLFNAQRAEEGLQVLDRAIARIPGDRPLLHVNKIIMLCNINETDTAEFAREFGSLAAMPYDSRMIKIYAVLNASVWDRRCPAINATMLRNLYQRMLAVPQNSDPTTVEYAQINYLLGVAFVYEREPSQALAAFETSLLARPGASPAMQMAALMASHEFYDDALFLSEIALRQLQVDNEAVITPGRVRKVDIESFQQVIRADIATALQDIDTLRPE